MKKSIFLFWFFLFSLSPLLAFSVASFTVNTTSDTVDASPGNGTCADSSGNCSLRAAIMEGNALGAATITLPAETYILTRTGSGEDSGATGDLDVTGNISILGAGASTTIINANSIDRVFHNPSSASTATFTLSGVTIKNGSGGASGGGALLWGSIVGGTINITDCTIASNTANDFNVQVNAGTLTVFGSTFTGNTATTSSGAAIGTTGSTVVATITNSTFTSNTAATSGGGIFAGDGTMTINNSTIVGNTGSSGAGIFRGTATVTMRNTIVSGNTGGNCNTSMSTASNNIDSGTSCGFGSSSGNLSSTDPLLNSIGSNGGGTQTFSLKNSSPALNAGSNSTCASTDQRGVTRPQSSTCDIGSFESRTQSGNLSVNTITFPDQIVNTTSSTQTVTLTNGGDFTLTITSIATTGDFGQTNDCGSSIAALGTCTISSTFTPTDTGSRTGTVVISSNDASSPQTVTLVGTSIANNGSAPGTQQQGSSVFGCGANLMEGALMRGAFGSFILLFPLAVFYMKRKKNKKFWLLPFLLVSFFCVSQAQAFSNSFSTEFFKPAVDDSEYFSVYSSPTLKSGNYHFGLWIDYAHRPLEVGNTTTFKRISGINDTLVAGHFLGSYSVLDWLNVGARIPVYFWDKVLVGNSTQSSFNMGDVELDLKFKLLDRTKHKIGLSVLPFATFPTATHAVRDYTGTGNFMGGAKIIVDGKPHERVSLALNAGFDGRQTFTNINGKKFGSHLLLGAGVAVDIIKKKLKVIAENQVETSVNDFFKRVTTPMEARVGLRYRMKNGINVNVGGGMGYLNGVSSPDFRVLAGITYTSGRIAEFTLKEPGADTVELKDEEVWAQTEVGQELKLKDKIYFDYNNANVRPISKPTLDKLALFLKNHPEFKKIKIVGHTCDLGSDPYNLKLSQHRADSVSAYLIAQGVDKNRFHVIGVGKRDPLVPNVDEASREQNRRVLFYLEEKN